MPWGTTARRCLRCWRTTSSKVKPQPFTFLGSDSGISHMTKVAPTGVETLLNCMLKTIWSWAAALWQLASRNTAAVFSLMLLPRPEPETRQNLSSSDQIWERSLSFWSLLCVDLCLPCLWPVLHCPPPRAALVWERWKLEVCEAH